eukprot:scaffold20587_cov110-Isochrysis_galbana.AAC.11
MYLHACVLCARPVQSWPTQAANPVSRRGRMPTEQGAGGCARAWAAVVGWRGSLLASGTPRPVVLCMHIRDGRLGGVVSIRSLSFTSQHGGVAVSSM